MCEQPTVDILLATYNGAEYLREQMDSIIAQSYENWRLLISDDCSQDDTLSIIQEYIDRDNRIELVSSGIRYGGAAKNFMSLLKHSSGEYAMFCDQDDVWDRNKIELTLQEMQALEEQSSRHMPLVVFTDLRVVGSDLHVIAPSLARYWDMYPMDTSYKAFLVRNAAPGCSMMMNSALVAALCENIDLPDGFIHDWWAISVAAVLGRVSYLDIPTSSYRQHESNAIGAKEYKAFSMTPIAIMKKSFALAVQQAELLLARFADKMDSETKQVVRDFSKSTSGGVKGVISLIRSGCWKKHLKQRVGQLVLAACPQENPVIQPPAELA